MGEAKRKNAAGRQLADALGRRLCAGEFGSGSEPALIVLDKSARGRELLAALRASQGLPGLQALLGAEPVRLWEASSLFPFLVLASGSGKPEQRSLLAGSRERLLQETLPRAWRRLAAGGAPVGIFCGMDEADTAAVQATLQGLRG